MVSKIQKSPKNKYVYRLNYFSLSRFLEKIYTILYHMRVDFLVSERSICFVNKKQKVPITGNFDGAGCKRAQTQSRSYP